MAFSIDTFHNLRQAIVDRLNTLGSDIVGQVKMSPVSVSNQSSFPAIVVDIASNEALFQSNKKDQVTFVFEITVMDPIRDDTDIEVQEENIDKIYWQLYHIFNQRDCLDGVTGLSDVLVEPLPSTFDVEESNGGGVYRVLRMNLRVRAWLNNQDELS
jgi:hypothetical protein